jgi:cytochrome c1
MMAALAALNVGCGTNFDEALLLAGESGARTFLDILVSDLYSDLPDLFTFPEGPGGDGMEDDADAPGDGANGDSDVDAGDDPSDSGSDDEGDADVPIDGGGGGLAGDSASGESLYMASFCGGCHCVDASGGCLPSAPDLRNASVAMLGEFLQGATPHLGGKSPDLTEQDLADLAAYLSAE